jgi:hypothetical protein
VTRTIVIVRTVTERIVVVAVVVVALITLRVIGAGDPTELALRMM